MRIRDISLIIVSAAFCFGCGPKQFWYKMGQTPQQAQKAELNCSVKAAQDVPVSIRQTQDVGEYVEGIDNCVETVTNGVRTKSCTKIPGYWREGAVTSYDANENLRGRYFQNCMAQQGYQRISLKECDRGAVTRATLAYPALRSGSCYIRAGGQDMIISQ